MLFLLIIDRNDRSQIFLEIAFFKKHCKFHRKTPVLGSLFNKVKNL